MSKKDKVNMYSENINLETGEIAEGKDLQVLIFKETIRPNGSRRIQQDFSLCPTMAEQHTAHLTDINYLMERYKPDELQAYINARNEFRRVIEGHDFSQEPSRQEGLNIILKSKQAFEDLPENVTKHFKNHVEFLKFIDNPQNQDRMIELGLLKRSEINAVIIPETNALTPTQTTPTQEKEDKAK